MKQKDVCKKILVVFLLIAIIFPLFTQGGDTIYAAINKEYAVDSVAGTINVDKAVEDAILVNEIGHFVYALAGLVEKLTVWLVDLLTGVKAFPWADRVIFNTMPVLDINFLSPSEGSLFLDTAKKTTFFGEIVGNMYYTIFVLAMSFFGVVVGVMAIRLATSSIAAEKAKYKSAIQNWVVALLLLFTTHYLISFIFYVNEKMVEVASGLLNERIGKINFSIDVNSWSDEECAHIVKVLNENSKGLTTSEAIDMILGGTGSSVNGDVIIEYYTENDTVKARSKTGQPQDEVLKKFNRYVAILLTTPEYMKERNMHDYETSAWYSDIMYAITTIFRYSTENGNVIADIKRDAAILTAEDFSSQKEGYNVSDKAFLEYINSVGDKSATLTDAYEMLNGEILDSKYPVLNIYKNYIKSSSVSTQKRDIFTNMADFFRNSVNQFKRDDTGKITSATATEFSPVMAILYSIFVIQSIMFFVSYIRRFFYVIILALFAPFVILYDFLMKSVSA